MRVAQDRCKRLGLLRHNRKGGRWDDRFVTLTIPHAAEHSITDRIEIVHQAWPHFLKRFNQWIRDQELRFHEHLHWYGSHEWKLGDDHKGHPHVHFWFIGPYLDHTDVEDWWRAALEKVGFGEPVERDDRPRRLVYEYGGPLIVDIKHCEDARGGVYELVKYLVKDVDGGELVGAAEFAEVYEALDGRRLRRASRGFVKLGETPTPCFSCGCVDCFDMRVVARPKPELETPAVVHRGRGPPKKRGASLRLARI